MDGVKRYTHRRATNMAGQSKSGSQSDSQSANFLVAEVQELFELNASVGEGSEGPLFLELGGELGIGSVSHGWDVECGLQMMMWSEGSTGSSGELYSRSR